MGLGAMFYFIFGVGSRGIFVIGVGSNVLLCGCVLGILVMHVSFLLVCPCSVLSCVMSCVICWVIVCVSCVSEMLS